MENEAPAPGRRRRNNPEAVRRRILDVAAAAFQARGYHSTSTHDIMRVAEVTSGALHHHFATKKALGLAVIRDRVAQVIEETWVRPVVTARTATVGILDVLDQIAKTVESRGQVFGCPLNNLALELSVADAEFRTELDHVFEYWRAAISDRIRADQKAGRMKGPNPEALAAFVIAAYSGAMTMAKTSQSSTPLRVCAQQLKRVLGTRASK